MFARVAGLAGLTGIARLALFTRVATRILLLLAARIGGGVEHGDFAAAHRFENLAVGEGTGDGRGGGRLVATRSGGAVAFVREGGRFPAL